MWIPLSVGVLVATVVTNIAAPVDPIPQKLHRESTKEILNLEQELKKAAGEDKKPREPAAVPQPPALLDTVVAEPAPQESAAHSPQAPAAQSLQAKGPVSQEPAEQHAIAKEPHHESSEEELEDQKSQIHASSEEESKLNVKQESKQDSTEAELEQEEAVAQEAAELKATQGNSDEDDASKAFSQPSKSHEKESSEQHEASHDESLAEEEDLAVLPSHSQPSLSELYEEYINEQAPPSYYEKRGYGEGLEESLEGNRDMFVASLLETLKQHPELLSEMQSVSEEETAALNDREEALRAEYLAATRGLSEPLSQYEPYFSDSYKNGVPSGGEPAPAHVEAYQNYPSDGVAKVVAKKWGYATPEEYYGLTNFKDSPVMKRQPEQADAPVKDVENPQHMEPVM